MRTKIVLIGAGSVMFTQGIVSDLIKRSDNRKWSLGLVDIEPDVLDNVARLVRKMLDAKGADIELSSSTDRREILYGADFVITSIGVGGRRAWEKDVLIPREYGIFQPVGDSVAVGGISRALRMIPAIIDIAKDVKEICPKAFFFNVSNPMTAICRAVDKALGIPMYGLCAGVNNIKNYLARFIQVPEEDVTAIAVGLNHFTWLYDVRFKGKDALPMIKAKREQYAAKGILPTELKGENATEWDTDVKLPVYENQPFCWSLFKTYGYYPACADSHVSEFFLERFPDNRYQGKRLGVDVFSFEKKIVKGDEIFNNILKYGNSNEALPESFFNEIRGESINLISKIESILEDSRACFTVNMPNRGTVPNLPDHAILEMTAAFTATGPRPLQASDFPDSLAATLEKHIAIAELTVSAALEGNRDMFIEAVMMGGYIIDRVQCAKLVDELLSAHKKYLPQFQ